MKKVIAFSICALLGGVAGYFSAPSLSRVVATWTEPQMFFITLLASDKSSVVCDCNDRPSNETEKELVRYLAVVQKAREKSPQSKMLAQETGLAYVRLSMIEQKLSQQSQAVGDIKRGQTELTALGWRDVSEPHLTSLVTQLNSEYQHLDGKYKTAATVASPR